MKQFHIHGHDTDVDLLLACIFFTLSTLVII